MTSPEPTAMICAIPAGGSLTLAVVDPDHPDPHHPLATLEVDLYNPDQIDLTITSTAHISTRTHRDR